MVMIGDSKSGQLPAPKRFMKAVWRWLESQFDGKWNDVGGSLPVGIQYDGNSCAICAINAIAYAVFKDQLWEQKRAGIERTKWFVAVAKQHIDDVRAEAVMPFKLCLPVTDRIALIPSWISMTTCEINRKLAWPSLSEIITLVTSKNLHLLAMRT